MEDFRKRRAAAAEAQGRAPGLKWYYKIDGRTVKKGRLRYGRDGNTGWASEIREVTLGNYGFADDTGIGGLEEEAREAEKIFVATLGDWEERVNEGKTERLRIGGAEAWMSPYDVRNKGEKERRYGDI